MNNLNFALSVILLVCCQGRIGNTRIEDSQIKFYRNYTSDTFDVERDPIAADINLIGAGMLDRSIVTEKNILDPITYERNYYKLFYYSPLQGDSTESFLLLGYYDYFYDLILVSVRRDSLIDHEIIASRNGDGDDFTRTSSSLSNKNCFKITRIKGKHESFASDIKNSDTEVYFLKIEKSGEFKRSKL